MNALARQLTTALMQIAPRFLPFADAATGELPLGRLLRLSLFQVSVGMATALLLGTLNRVMIVELGVAASIVSAMVALPIVFAPFRTLVGFKSDYHISALGWRRVPFIWLGTMLQFGGLAIMPFALLVLTGTGHGPAWIGTIGAALAFLLVGAGLQVTQTAGLALATDIAAEGQRPQVVSLMYVMLLVGMVASGFTFSALLDDFSATRLIQVIQGAAAVTMVLNVVALWKQEARDPSRTRRDRPRPTFGDTWRAFMRKRRAMRFLVAVGLGTAAFNMQDIVLEPYGGEILHLPVGATAALTALFALGALGGFGLAARRLGRGADPCRLAAWGVVVGLAAFAAVICAAPFESPLMFRAGTVLIGFGGGLFSVGTLTYAMGLDEGDQNGFALGAWGAVQATSAGLAIAFGGVLRDATNSLAADGLLGPALASPSAGYGAVYHAELFLLFATLVAIGPLVRSVGDARSGSASTFGLAEFPG